MRDFFMNMQMTEKEIIELLKDLKSKALALYSNFHVASVLISKDNQPFTGFNIECSSYGLTICAERVALFKALSEGEREFQKIYVMADGKEPCPPCGACRQVLMDYAPDIDVFMVSETEEIKKMKLADLLPNAFKNDNLHF